MRSYTRVLIAWVGTNKNGRQQYGDYSVTTDWEYPFSSDAIDGLKKQICGFFEDIETVSILNIIPLRLENSKEELDNKLIAKLERENSELKSKLKMMEELQEVSRIHGSIIRVGAYTELLNAIYERTSFGGIVLFNRICDCAEKLISKEKRRQI